MAVMSVLDSVKGAWNEATDAVSDTWNEATQEAQDAWNTAWNGAGVKTDGVCHVFTDLKCPLINDKFGSVEVA
jgi:hypothetical protein